MTDQGLSVTDTDRRQGHVVFRQPVSNFLWSPDGTRLAFTVRIQPHTSLWTVNADGSAARQVQIAPAVDLGAARLRAWSPDGRWLLISPNQARSESIAADGLPVIIVPVEGGPAKETAHIMLQHTDFLSVAPLPSEMLLVSGNNREAWTNKQLVKIDPAAGSSTALTNERSAVGSATWSPDGKRIAYAAGPDDGTDRTLPARRIWLMDADGQNARPLTVDTRYRDEAPRWSRDGRTILFLRVNVAGKTSVWIVDASGGEPQKILDGLWTSGYYGHMSWSGELALYR